MIELRSALSALVISIVFTITSIGAAAALEPWPWQIEHTWYKTKITCVSRGIALVETKVYSSYRCKQDETSDPGRWTLYVKRSGSGGGGGGSWNVSPSGA